MEKKCLQCGEKILGRVDKKFCCDQCRNTYNNLQNRDANNYIRNVNNILRKNHRILSELNPNGKINLPKQKLFEKGFNFNYHTNIFETKAGKVYHFCYDQGYLFIDNEYVTLVVKKEYVD